MFKINKLNSLIAISMVTMSFSSLADTEKHNKVKEMITENQPQFQGASIRVGQELSNYGLEGFYEVNVQGQDLIITPNARYAILGDLFDLQQMRNISEEVRNEKIGEVAGNVISNLNKDIMIRYKHNDDVDYIGEIYVFTDPTCPFCTRVHEELKEYAVAGVNVNYIPYPRSGVSSDGRDYQMLTRSLCSENPHESIDTYKMGGNTEELDNIDGSYCHDKVAAGYAAGQEIGVSGTPFIYLSNGSAIPGYRPSEQIIENLLTQ